MGAPVEVTWADHTASELRAISRQCTDATQVRRMLAIAMVLEGRPRAEAAGLNGMDRQTLRDWVHRYNAFGIAGLKSRPSPGRAPMLSKEQQVELYALVVAGPDPKVHRVVRWRCVDLQAEVERRFGVKVHEYTIARWLHELGLTRLQPRPSHPQKKPEAEAAFKKTLPIWSAPPCPKAPRASLSKSGFRMKPASVRKAATPTSGHRSALVPG